MGKQAGVRAVACAWLSLVAAAQSSFCGICSNGGAPPMQDWQLQIACTSPGAVISAVPFASYGTPNTAPGCGNFTLGPCNAANSSRVVQDTCLGRQSCVVWPNTTTFGDPCFGTAKVIAVAMSCSSGTGTATAVVPAPPPLAPFNASVTVDWSRPVGTPVQAVPSLQVVSHHLLFRDSPVHDAAFASLKALGVKRARFVPWIPYPQSAVVELSPPSGAALCGPASWTGGQARPFALDCGAGEKVAAVDFASRGTAAGVCGTYTVNPACHASNSAAVVSAACVGRQSCVLDPAAFGPDPCPGAYTAVQVRCSDYPAARHTYYNFTLPDQLMLDFWDAVDGDASDPIPNFSTQPTWLYSPAAFSYPEDQSQAWYGYDRGTAPAANATLLAEAYGRLLAWYTRGGFTDAYGIAHAGGHALNVSHWEVFNEPDYEHGHTKESYLADFDAVVTGIRALADPGHRIQFVGLNLPNIDSAATVVEWANFFLNASNHAPTASDALDAVGYHAYPTNGGYSPDPSTFSGLFSYVDEFVAERVSAVDAVIAALSPATVTMLDETGCDMDNVLDPALPPPANNPRYWVACGGYFAYMFARVATGTSVRVVAASQLMDSPGQEPSVTLLDWTTGKGTARYWVLALLLDSVALADAYVQTALTANGTAQPAPWASPLVYAQALLHTPDPARTPLAVPRPPGAAAPVPSVLLINKVNAVGTVTLPAPPAALGAAAVCTLHVVDERTALGPPRQEDCTGAAAVELQPFATAVVTFA